MLILPIVNKNRVMNVELRLKNASKIKRNVYYEDAKESDIIVNKERFTDSNFSKSNEKNAPIDFIRSKSILYPRNFLITTKKQANNKYDIYELTQPPKKVNDGLDELYSKAITDLRQEIPNTENRGRYVSLQELGIDKDLTSEKIARLQQVVKENKNKENFGEKLKASGVESLQESINFFNNFECNVLADSIIPETSLQDTLKALSTLHTRDYKNLNKYYNTAKTNSDIFTRISFISKILYDKPLRVVHKIPSKGKQLVKKKEESDYSNAA